LIDLGAMKMMKKLLLDGPRLIVGGRNLVPMKMMLRITWSPLMVLIITEITWRWRWKV